MKINDIIINESIGLGDNFDIELGNMIIESRVVGFMNDGVIIEADNKALALLGLGGALLESVKQGVAEESESDYDARMRRLAAGYKDMSPEIRARKEKIPGWKDQYVQALDYVKKHPKKDEQGVAEGSLEEVSLDLAKRARDKAEYFVDMDYDDMRDRPYGYSEKQRSKFQRYIDRKEPRAKGDRDWDPPNKGVAEGFNSDLEMELHQLTKSPDMYDAIYNALGKNDAVGSHLQDMLYDIARENRLHPDDDQEQIIDIIADRLESDYGDPDISEAKYQGREVPLGKPMRGDVKKSKVYVRGPKGNVVKVNFGDKKMKIKKSNPKRRKSFRARHNCANPGPRWKARYWSCRAW